MQDILNQLEVDGPPDNLPEVIANIWLPYAKLVDYRGHDDMEAFGRKPPSMTRDQAIRRYSFALPCPPALRACVEEAPNGRILEIGSGTGYWAKLLTEAGADVVAVDTGREFPDPYHFPATIRETGEAYLERHNGAPDRALFLCWPRECSSFISRYRGDTVIFIGELDGCTGDMEGIEGWRETRRVVIPTWPLIHDLLIVYKRS